MSTKLKHNGFSLTEVLLAVGTLSIGMIFIGGTFLAGVYFSTIATERSIAAVAADEAFAKVRLYGVNLSGVQESNCVDFNEVSQVQPFDPNEFSYPSIRTDLDEKQYFWSALCRLTEDYDDVNNPPLVQVTVFVSRKAGGGTKYHHPAYPLDPDRFVDYPMPIKVSVTPAVGSNELTIQDPDRITWINDGDTIVEDTTGQIYQVIERYADQPSVIRLNKSWDPAYPDPDWVWVVPPAIGGGRGPCIAVYQKLIEF